MPLPDIFVIGAPKAGSTAVHAALASHADIHMSVPKEPKYFLCGDTPPPPYRGPGDAHSRKEWVWRREDYERLFAEAPDGSRLGESTPFYLWSTEAQARIAEAVPEARLIAIVRDPVDRAYSNWSHLRGHGYEPVGDFVAAVEQEPRRVADGWAPFWHYVALGRYGEQLQHLYEHFRASRCSSSATETSSTSRQPPSPRSPRSSTSIPPASAPCRRRTSRDGRGTRLSTRRSARSSGAAHGSVRRRRLRCGERPSVRCARCSSVAVSTGRRCVPRSAPRCNGTSSTTSVCSVS